MKLTFSFIVTCFIVISSIGQTENTNFKECGKIQHYGSGSIEIVDSNLYKELANNHFNTFILKSAQLEDQLLDSTVTETFDVATGQYVTFGKTINTYDSYGNKTSNTAYNWDKNNSKWIGAYKYEYTYDSNSKLTTYIIYNWSAFANKWLEYNKYENFYDSNGRNTLRFRYTWDKNNSTWLGYYKYEYSYDSNGNQIQYVYNKWDINVSEWISSTKTENTFDSNGNIKLSIRNNWDVSASVWVISSKTENTYDSNNNNILSTVYNWDKNISTWAVNSKTEYTYDSNGNMTLSASSNWNIDSWIYSFKVEHTFESNGLKTNLAFYNWDPSLNKWVGDEKEDYIYSDITSNLYSYFFQFEWNMNAEVWDKSAKITCYYSKHDIASGANRVLKSDIKTYPNPFTNGFHISGLNDKFNITLTNMKGTVCLSKVVVNDEYVSTDALPKGVYLLRINTKQGSIVNKIVKR